MELCSNRIQSDLYTRRDMLRGLSCGFGMLGFSQLAFGQGLLDGANRSRHAPRIMKRRRSESFSCLWKVRLLTSIRLITSQSFLGLTGSVATAIADCWVPPSNSSSMAKAGFPSANCFRTWPGTRIVCVCSMACTLTSRPTLRPKCRCIPVPPSL